MISLQLLFLAIWILLGSVHLKACSAEIRLQSISAKPRVG